MSQGPTTPNSWKFDRVLSIGALLAVLGNAIPVIFWVAALSERANTLEQKIGEIQDSKISERLARVEERQEAAKAQLDRIERKLDSP